MKCKICKDKVPKIFICDVYRKRVMGRSRRVKACAICAIKIVREIAVGETNLQEAMPKLYLIYQEQITWAAKEEQLKSRKRIRLKQPE